MDEALERIERRTKRIGRIAIVGVRSLLILLFAGSIALTIVGSIAGSVPLWIGLLLAAVTAVPNILQTLDWVWTGDSLLQAALERLQEGIERRLWRRSARKLFELYGAEGLANRLANSNKRAEADKPYFSVSRRTRRRRQTRLGAGIALVLVVSALIAVKLLHRSSVHYFAVGQEFHVDSTFAITVRGDPSCRRNTELSAERECDVSVVVRNISHYDADIGSGSFAPIQDAYADQYGASLVSHGDNYDYVDGEFDKNRVSAGRSTEATLEFGVAAGVIPEELRISGQEQSGVSVVSFRDKRD